MAQAVHNGFAMIERIASPMLSLPSPQRRTLPILAQAVRTPAGLFPPTKPTPTKGLLIDRLA